ncbi:MAG: NAD(P)-dependent oxidoreductase [Stappiaceae bacterium]
MRHVLVGGSGFVGQALVRDLTEMGEEVVIADIQKPESPTNDRVQYQALDITNRDAVLNFDIRETDMVYNLSAKMLSPILPRAKRRDFFWPVNHDGLQHLLDRMEVAGSRKLVHFTTDMVYGHIHHTPTREDHPTKPLGEYGLSKLASESLCQTYRDRGFRISIFRPRLIIGPGRLGILQKLFKLVDNHLPVPTIGGGRNPYQFVSVYDCAQAAWRAWQAGVPNNAYNLGSKDPPSIRSLLGRLITEARSYSLIIPTPAPAVKFVLDALDWANVPLMDPEQYKIADEVCIVDTTAAERDLGWHAGVGDTDMLLAAYWDYRAAKGDRRAADQLAALMAKSQKSNA